MTYASNYAYADVCSKANGLFNSLGLSITPLICVCEQRNLIHSHIYVSVATGLIGLE